MTKEELNVLVEKDFDIPRIEIIRDIFLFSFYSGLAYADVKKFNKV